MAVTMAVSVVEIILIAIFVILLVFIIKRAGKKAWILIPVICLGILLFLIIIPYRSETVSLLYDRDPELLEQVQSQSAIWSDAIDDYFEADHYASMPDAAEYLAHSLARELKDTRSKTSLVVYGQDPVTTKTLNAFADAIRTQLSVSNVRIETVKPDTLASDINVIECVLDVPKHQTSSSHINGLLLDHSYGTLQARVENTPNALIRSAEFVQKNWVNTLSGIQNQGTSSVMVARSNSSCTAETEARDQAMLQAVTMVQDLLRKSNQDYAVLNQEIDLTPQDLKANDLVADQFSQSLRTSAARVWRHAVLLNLDPHKMQSLLQRKTRQIKQVHKSWAKELMSLAGLALVVLILYIFLNAATRGYYAWSLRVIAVLVIVGIMVVLLLV